MSASSVVIIGGHGKIALRLSSLLAPTHKIISIIRDPSHSAEVSSTGAQPVVLSLEDAPKEEFTKLFDEVKADVVVFAAGSGGKGGPERLKSVDYEGALKVFDAVEAMEKPARVLLVSAGDTRDRSKPAPEYYDDQDLKASDGLWGALEAYMQYKYEADKNLWSRTKFKWTIIRPWFYSDAPGTGKASVGRTHLRPDISRDDVAKMLALLVDRPDAAGLALDIAGGEKPIEQALDGAIKDRVTATY